MLENLSLRANPIGKRGAAALCSPLRSLPALKRLNLRGCGLGDEGVASLVASIGKDDFQSLTWLDLKDNTLTQKGCAPLVSAIESGAMPKVLILRLAGRNGDSTCAGSVGDG